DTREGDEGVKAWVDQLRETSFRIEDVIDEYVEYLSKKVKNSGSVALIKKVAQKFKTVNQRDQIASAIQDIKSSLVKINERRLRYDFKAENGPGSSRGATQNENDGDPRMASLFIEATQIVGFEKPTKDLVRRLVEGTKELVLVSVVGMGGLGKTTLSNHVFHNERVEEHFDYRLFITVSQSYTVRELLINM
ncbi:NBS-containing resistance-like protein, partial [Trifolium pratense]